MSEREVNLIRAFLNLCVEEGVTFKRSLDFGGYSGPFPFRKPEQEKRYEDLFRAAIEAHLEDLVDEA